MSHIGFIAPPFLGHLNPMRALAGELMARGHRATFLGIEDMRASAGGCGFVPLGHTSHPVGALSRLKAHMASPRGLGLFRIIGDMARMTDMLCREAPAAIAAHGIDALVVDQLEPAGGLIATHLDLPFVSVANALPINREPAVPLPFTGWRYDPSPWGLRRNDVGYRIADMMMGQLGRVIAAWSARWGLPHVRRVDECLSPLAQVTQMVAGFDFPRMEPPARFHHCGPLRALELNTTIAPLLGDGTRPVAFASLGTLQGGRLDLFQRIAEACRALDLHLVIAHGGALTPEQEASLPDATVRSFVPQRALLAHAAVAITNGGLNTVMDALAAGVPLVVVPIAFEQGAIAARLEACGAGVAVPLRRSGVRPLMAAIESALLPSTARAAARIAAEIAAAGGVARAATIVEAAIGADRSSAFAAVPIAVPA